MLLKIDKLVYGGKGLAHDGSLAVFVPGVLPGETVRVLIDSIAQRLCERLTP
jgi:tRNA/tmRNA/rRNA uracil-C5-methylase (TrmA/RlmC/RlmD family)